MELSKTERMNESFQQHDFSETEGDHGLSAMEASQVSSSPSGIDWHSMQLKQHLISFNKSLSAYDILGLDLG